MTLAQPDNRGNGVGVDGGIPGRVPGAVALVVLLAPSALQQHSQNTWVHSLLERSLQNSLLTITLPPAVGGDLLPATLFGMEGINTVEECVGFVLCEVHLLRQWLYEAYSTRSRFDRDWAEARLAVQQPAFPANHPVSMAMRKTSTGRQAMPSFFGQHIYSSAAWSTFHGGAPLEKNTSIQLNISAEAMLRDVVWLLSARWLASAYVVVLQRIAPDAILRGDHSLLARILEHLNPEGNGSAESVEWVPSENWACGGQVYLSFLAAVEDVPAVVRRIASAGSGGNSDTDLDGEEGAASELGDQALGFLDESEAWWHSEEEACELRVKYSVAVSDMASTITGFIQEVKACMAVCEDGAEHMEAGTATVPLAQDMRIVRTCQVAQWCFDSLVGGELEA
ncbi:hypothetical protein GQ54DRAFT_314664 [Martensiomyces pterosporus]|nr:hypothetical protein GQ54DRAFT_314664 [Martensiomyces pterosporus]